MRVLCMLLLAMALVPACGHCQYNLERPAEGGCPAIDGFEPALVSGSKCVYERGTYENDPRDDLPALPDSACSCAEGLGCVKTSIGPACVVRMCNG